MSAKLLKSGLIVSLMTFISRILGLVRDVVTANVLGAGAAADVFLMVNRIPNFLRRLFAEGAFSQAFVPVLSEVKARHGDDAVRELIGSGVDFDALVCASDVIALSALRALTSCGLNVPQDVAVTGYDDIPLAAHANPSLTTVHQDLPLAAATLVERLFRRMDGHNLPSITLPSRVVVRESSAPVTGA